MDQKDPKPSLKQEFSAINLGYTMMAGMILFAVLGNWADRKFNGGYRWTLTGLLLGFFMGLYEAWKTVARMNAQEEERKEKKKEPLAS